MSNHLKLANRLAQVKPSVTMAVTAKAAELRASGRDIISFGAGEPDFATPDYIVEAVRQSLTDPNTFKYTNVRGRIDLREAVAAELNKIHGKALTTANIVVSCGAKHSLYNICMALFDAGDEVIIPAPYWVSYPAMVRLSDATPVILPSSPDDGYMIDPDALSAAITTRTRALILNNPSNPTGAVYSRKRLATITKICANHNIFVISDDIYRSLVYTGSQYHSIARVCPELGERAIFVDGVSKSYAMTGWRIGFVAAAEPIASAIAKIQSQSTSNAPHISQLAALAALTHDRRDQALASMHAIFDGRRKKMHQLLSDIDGVHCPEPRGAFYAFPDLSAFIGQGKMAMTDVELATQLVEDAGVAAVPGSGFGAPGNMRLSYACSDQDIEQGIARLASVLRK